MIFRFGDTQGGEGTPDAPLKPAKELRNRYAPWRARFRDKDERAMREDFGCAFRASMDTNNAEPTRAPNAQTLTMPI